MKIKQVDRWKWDGGNPQLFRESWQKALLPGKSVPCMQDQNPSLAKPQQGLWAAGAKNFPMRGSVLRNRMKSKKEIRQRRHFLQEVVCLTIIFSGRLWNDIGWYMK